MSKSTPDFDPAFISAVYQACLKLHNHTLNETGQKRPNGTGQNANVESGDTDLGAIMYISAVLLFYSTGIIIMIIKYLKTEKADMEEDVALEQFFKQMPTNKVEKENHVNKVAIHAFHTLTSAGHGRVERRDVTGEESPPPFPIRECNSTVINVDDVPKTLLVTDV